MLPLHTLAFWTPSPAELVVIMIVALLLFGRRLPEVARNLGKGVVEFKKGLKGVEDDVEQGGSSSGGGSYSSSSPPSPQVSQPTPSGSSVSEGGTESHPS